MRRFGERKVYGAFARYLAVVLCAWVCAPLGAAERFAVGLASDSSVIEGLAVPSPSAERTILIVGGLQGEDASAAAVRGAVTAHEKRGKAQRNRIRLLAIPLANATGAPLSFPPSGVAYRENREANALWRWTGYHAPDLVLIAGEQDFGLAEALSSQTVAGVGRIPAQRVSMTSPDALRDALLAIDPARIAPSEARLELDRRRARTPRELAEELAQHYGREFDTPWYIQAIALIARIRLGQQEDVQRLAEPYVDGTRNSLTRPNSLVLAGHLVFTELARRTGDQRYVSLVKKVADLGFEADGRMKESMPYHDGYSDSVFMGTVIAAQAGALTGDQRYFDLAARHVEFMQRLVLRPDGLYRHSTEVDAAWGRGNGFPAIGLALALPELPKKHPARARLVRDFRAHMRTLAKFQGRDGLWHNVVDEPATFAELSGTAMIGFSMLTGVQQGWLRKTEFQPHIDAAWRAVLERVGRDGLMSDSCESTFGLKTVEDYRNRAALLGPDPRAGAMVMMFATAMAGLD